MASRRWAGQDLINLLSMSKPQLLTTYPDHKWNSLKDKRKLYRRKIREGLISLPVTDNIAETEEKNELLRSQNKQLKIQLDESREKTLEYVAALRTAVFEAVVDIKIDPPKTQRIDYKTSKQEEIAVVDVSDLQLGKETPSYNMEIAAKRMRKLAQSVIEISSIQNTHHPVKRLHIQLLGDIVEGEGIFPGQPHQIHGGLYRQILQGQKILTNFILDCLNYFDTIHITAVIGNHGTLKIKGDLDPETNMDRLVYSIARENFKNEKRVTWNIPEGRGQRNWYAVNRVFDWGFLLAHGDQIRGWGGFPFYGAMKKSMGWIDAIDEVWDYAHMAHHHTPTMLSLNKRTVVFNGTTESGNEFAQELLAAVGHPTQWLGFVHPRQGVTAQYWVNLETKTPNLQRYIELVNSPRR